MRYRYILLFLAALLCAVFVPHSVVHANFYAQQQMMRQQQMMQQQRMQQQQQAQMRRQQEEMRRQQQRQQQAMRERQRQMQQRQQQAAKQRQQMAERQRQMQQQRQRKQQEKQKFQKKQKVKGQQQRLAKQQKALQQQQALHQQQKIKNRKDNLRRLQKKRLQKKKTDKQKKDSRSVVTMATLASLQRNKLDSQQRIARSTANNKTTNQLQKKHQQQKQVLKKPTFKSKTVKQFQQRRLQQQKKQRVTKQLEKQRKTTQARMQKVNLLKKRLQENKQKDKKLKRKQTATQKLAQNNFNSCTNGRCRPSTCSFHGDTFVLTKDGFEPIKSLVVGEDLVWSRSEITGEMAWKAIENHYSNSYDETLEITIYDAANDGVQSIRSNRIHPFYVGSVFEADLRQGDKKTVLGISDTGQWIEAQYLQPGQRLLDSDGDWLEVTRINITTDPLQAYNLTVADFHTYFVKGAVNNNITPVWVHNDCNENATKSVAKPTVKQRYADAVQEAMRRHNGNVTVQRNGVDLFRVHQPTSGHGTNVTQIVRRSRPSDGKIFPTPKEVPVRRTHVRQLERALRGDPRYSLRTRGGQ